MLVTARAIDQPYEWVAHAKIARAEKLPDDVIERVRTRGDLAALPPRLARPARVVQHVLACESIPRDRCKTRCSKSSGSAASWSWWSWSATTG